MVANPPYMGSKNMGAWLSGWVKRGYPEACKDLCTCFVTRGLSLSRNHGHVSMITASSWMFISSFEEFRKKLLASNSICSMIQQSTHGYAGVTVPTTMFVLAKGCLGIIGSYIRLEDFDRPQWQAPRASEALADPEGCPWFYRADAADFSAIPGSPIAYWASEAVLEAFRKFPALGEVATPRQGLATGDNARFLRLWWEVAREHERFDCASADEAARSGLKWFPYNKGGEYRKWYGNNDWVVNWENSGEDIRSFSGSVIRNPGYYFCPSITWSKISSGSIAFRYKPQGHIFDVAGTSIFSDRGSLLYLQGVCNSSAILHIASILSPTLNFEVGQVASYPVTPENRNSAAVRELVSEERVITKADWDSHETSWDFKRHPLI